jgi:hypothetical protein
VVAGGPGADRIVCGQNGPDLAIVDRNDTIASGCERVKRRG